MNGVWGEGWAVVGDDVGEFGAEGGKLSEGSVSDEGVGDIQLLQGQKRGASRQELEMEERHVVKIQGVKEGRGG